MKDYVVTRGRKSNVRQEEEKMKEKEKVEVTLSLNP